MASRSERPDGLGVAADEGTDGFLVGAEGAGDAGPSCGP
jgi:hypothetical protein